jgi:mannose-6-phosphate isomerase-like protein (cupin superfamily)
MHTIVRKQDATSRKISAHKTVYNLITKDISPTVSFAVIETDHCNMPITAEYDYIYFVIQGAMTLTFEKEKLTLHPGDSCYITKGETYGMIGTFRTAVVNQPAFGT